MFDEEDELSRIRTYSRAHMYDSSEDVANDMRHLDLDHLVTFDFLEAICDRTPHRLLCYLQTEVWGDVFRTAYWNEGPLERFTMTLMTSVDEHGIRVLDESLAHGAQKDRMACNIHTWVRKHILTLNHSETLLLCNMLCRLSGDESARECLEDVQLFRDLSKRSEDHDDIMAAVLDVFLASKMTRLPHSLLMAERAAHCLILDFRRVHHLESHDHLRKSLLFLEILSTWMEWHSLLTKWVVTLSRYGWPLSFGRLVANMLSTPSVQFLVDMHRRDKLNFLIRVAHQHSEASKEWRVVRGRLRTLWPSRFAKVLNLADVCRTSPITTYECPITLQQCVYPTVASDGHTYERDALLIFLSTTDPISPITKARLEPVLFENYALCK